MFFIHDAFLKAILTTYTYMDIYCFSFLLFQVKAFQICWVEYFWVHRQVLPPSQAAGEVVVS